jgi:hypothetical protein
MASGQSDSFCKEGIIMETPTVLRVGLFALAIVALGFVPGVSEAKSSSAKGKGDFMLSGDQRTFSFHAIKHHNGEVTGKAEVHHKATAPFVIMTIDCLRFVTPNTVLVSGPITKSDNASNLVGLIGVFEAQDNREGTKDNEEGTKDNDEGTKDNDEETKGNDEGTKDNREGTNSPPDRISLLHSFYPGGGLIGKKIDCNTSLVLELIDIQHGNIKVRP